MRMRASVQPKLHCQDIRSILCDIGLPRTSVAPKVFIIVLLKRTKKIVTVILYRLLVSSRSR
jgi:hypothetical protein